MLFFPNNLSSFIIDICVDKYETAVQDLVLACFLFKKNIRDTI